jgi:hypothetical protein
VRSIRWNSKECDRVYAIPKSTSQRGELSSVDELTDEIAHARHLLYLWPDTQSVAGCSWPDSHNLGHFRDPKSSLEPTMGKSSVFLHVPGTRMAHGDHKVEQVHHRYAEK